MVSNCNYDILMGSDKTRTPFKYEINYRNYFLCTKGFVTIKMTPPHSTKFLQPIYDYENFEFRSKINPWNNDFEKVKFLEVTLTEGKTLFIPAYWWYSIEFTNQSCVVSYKYRTYMNNVAILPYFGLYFLQNQNIKRNSYNTVDLDSKPNLREILPDNNETTLNVPDTVNNNVVTTNTLDANNDAFDTLNGPSNKLLFTEV